MLGDVTGSLPPAEQIGTELSHFEVLSRLRDPLHDFFAKVFVMVEDTRVRNNRLVLLKAVYDLLGNIMDFARIDDSYQERGWLTEQNGDKIVAATVMYR